VPGGLKRPERKMSSKEDNEKAKYKCWNYIILSQKNTE
jgi:hypothetical protein